MADKDRLADTIKEVAPYMGLGVQLAASIVIMLFVGQWLDEKFESEPVLTLIFAFIGGAAGLFNFIKAATKIEKKSENDEK